jgi:hypothetical protein
VIAGVICVAVLTGTMEAVMALVQRLVQPKGIRRREMRLSA